MNKKLYITLLAMFAGNYVTADYVRSIGRTLNGNNFVKQAPDEKISFTEAKQIKRDLNTTTKNVSNVSKKSAEVIKAKVANLKDLIEKSQISKKSKK